MGIAAPLSLAINRDLRRKEMKRPAEGRDNLGITMGFFN